LFSGQFPSESGHGRNMYSSAQRRTRSPVGKPRSGSISQPFAPPCFNNTRRARKSPQRVSSARSSRTMDPPLRTASPPRSKASPPVLRRAMDPPMRTASPPRTKASPPASRRAPRKDSRAFQQPPSEMQPPPSATFSAASATFAAPPPVAPTPEVAVPIRSSSEEDSSQSDGRSGLDSSWGSMRPCDIRDRAQWEKLRKQDEEVIAQSLEMSLRLRDTAGAALSRAATWKKTAERRGLVADSERTVSSSDEDASQPTVHSNSGSWNSRIMEALESDAEGLHARSLRIEQTRQRQIELLEELTKGPSARIRGLHRKVTRIDADSQDRHPLPSPSIVVAA